MERRKRWDGLREKKDGLMERKKRWDDLMGRKEVSE
jgi:hypothetical protein